MRITSAGNVGINTSSPSTELEVYGTIKAHEKSGIAQASIIIDALATGNPNLVFQQAGTSKGYIHYIDASDTICLNDGSGNGLHYSPTLQRLGIGTNAPSQALDVVGSIEVSDGIYIGGTGTANKLDDYEEGEYDITATDSGGGATIELKTYANRLRYTKIGSIVHVQGTVQVHAISGTYSGTTTINLPFASADLIDTGETAGSLKAHYCTFDSGASPYCFVGESSTELVFRTSRSGNSPGNLTIPVSQKVTFQITYVTN